MKFALVALCLTVSLTTAQPEPKRFNVLHLYVANGDSGGTLTARQAGNPLTFWIQPTTADGTPVSPTTVAVALRRARDGV